jgi:outer membrane protein
MRAPAFRARTIFSSSFDVSSGGNGAGTRLRIPVTAGARQYEGGETKSGGEVRRRCHDREQPKERQADRICRWAVREPADIGNIRSFIREYGDTARGAGVNCLADCGDYGWQHTARIWMLYSTIHQQGKIMKFIPALVVGSGFAVALAAHSARADEHGEGNFEARVRAVYLSPANKSDAIPALAVPSDAIHINSKTLPEVDFEYFFTPTWSSELILTYPQSQTVTVEKSALGGPAAIGTFKHLPPILTVKYNFNPAGDFRPYVGAGVNFTLLSDVRLAVPTAPPMALELSRTSVGPAVQGGFDYKFMDHWFANVDVKWAMMRVNLKFDSATLAQLRVDPALFAIGVGYRW